MSDFQPLTTRASGILLHPTSLPGGHGIGDLGPEAHRFLEFLARSGQTYWQMLPIHPPGLAYSPYVASSALAGSPWLVSLDGLAREGLLDRSEMPAVTGRADRVDFPQVFRKKMRALRTAHERGLSRALAGDLARFREAEAAWLDDYALYVALEKAHGGVPWTEWDSDVRRRKRRALERARRELKDEIEFRGWVQFFFFRQWAELREAATMRGVRLIGDLPIYVAHRSADVWARAEEFHLDSRGRQSGRAGVPPDYFNRNGQLWGNPLYRWSRMASRGYDWWVARVRQSLRLFDAVRLDHFIGFHRAWCVSPRAKTAQRGRWLPGPGEDLFRVLKKELGRLPFVAEDLGLVTPEVEALRDRLDLPGMRVLQFAFGGRPENPNLPHHYPRRMVVHTGTHDNMTVAQWFHQRRPNLERRSKREMRETRAMARRYFGNPRGEAHWEMIRLALASVADTAVVPVQDVLGLGAEGRMNQPGTARGNWAWRMRPRALRARHANRLRELTRLYSRDPRVDGNGTEGAS